MKMPERRFKDEQGREWEVWEVCPDVIERRVAAEGSPPPDLEERRRGERRAHVRFPERLREGWLAFDSGDQRRRLAPVPDGWRRLPEHELRELLRTAEVARSDAH